jgi:hypothetical protein
LHRAATFKVIGPTWAFARYPAFDLVIAFLALTPVSHPRTYLVVGSVVESVLVGTLWAFSSHTTWSAAREYERTPDSRTKSQTSFISPRFLYKSLSTLLYVVLYVVLYARVIRRSPSFWTLSRDSRAVLFARASMGSPYSIALLT